MDLYVEINLLIKKPQLLKGWGYKLNYQLSLNHLKNFFSA